MAQSIFDLLVNLFFLVAVAAWLLALAETAGSFMLWRWVFQLGPALFSIRRQSPVVLAQAVSGETHETKQLKYRFIGDNTCVFRRKYFWFEFRFNTLLDPKGTLEWGSAGLVAVGRPSLGALAFVTLWLSGWTVGALLAMRQDPWSGMSILLLGWAAIAVMFVPAWFVERRRFSVYVDELLEAVGAAPSS